MNGCPPDLSWMAKHNMVGPSKLKLFNPGAKYFFFEDLLHPLVKKLLAFERSYIISAFRKLMLDMPVPGSFRNMGH